MSESPYPEQLRKVELHGMHTAEEIKKRALWTRMEIIFVAHMRDLRSSLEGSVQSKAKDVTTYMEEAPAERQETLRRLRELCRTFVTGFEETLKYGGPSYKRHGEVEVGFASQKHFLGLYILRTDVMAAHRNQLKGKGIRVGKGAIRYSRPEQIDFNVVESMLRGMAESTGPVC